MPGLSPTLGRRLYHIDDSGSQIISAGDFAVCSAYLVAESSKARRGQPVLPQTPADTMGLGEEEGTKLRALAVTHGRWSGLHMKKLNAKLM